MIDQPQQLTSYVDWQ